MFTPPHLSAGTGGNDISPLCEISLHWWHGAWCMKCLAGVGGCSSVALFGWSSWKKSLHSNARRSWVVTWETHLPTAFLLVYQWRDDTEELCLTLYKAAPSAASRSFNKDRWGWNSVSIPPTGSKQNVCDTLHHEWGRTGFLFFFVVFF